MNKFLNKYGEVTMAALLILWFTCVVIVPIVQHINKFH